jgi:hypothetical protein
MYKKIAGKDMATASHKTTPPKPKPSSSNVAHSSSANGIASGAKRESPLVERKLPDFKRDPSADVKREVATKRESPDLKREYLDVRRSSPQLKRESPVLKRESSDPKCDAPETKHESSDVKPAIPEIRTESADAMDIDK